MLHHLFFPLSSILPDAGGIYCTIGIACPTWYTLWHNGVIGNVQLGDLFIKSIQKQTIASLLLN